MGVVNLVRHGQASFGAADYDVLSEGGEEQARLLGAALAQVRPTRLVHGTPVRQRRTAELAAVAAGWAVEPTVDPRWDEIGAVPLPSVVTSLEDAQHAYEEGLERWTAAGDGAGYDETWADFLARTTAALTDLAGEGDVVVVTSGGPIAAVATTLLDGSPVVFGRLMRVLVNASLTQVVSGRRGLSLLTFNDHAHLRPHHVTHR